MKAPASPTYATIRGPLWTVVWAGTIAIIFAMLTLPYMGTMQSGTRGELRPGLHNSTVACADAAHEDLLLSVRKELDRIGVQLDPEQEYLFNALRVDMYVKSQAFLSSWAAQEAQVLPPQRRRGILMLAAGRDTSLNAAVNILLMRNVHKSRLPLEVVYYGDKERYPPLEALLKGINSTEAPIWYIDGEETVAAMKGNLSHHRSDAPLGYATKVHALAYVTRFREVLMVDSDCTLLVAPEAMFRIPEYVNHGNLFWPDYWGSEHPMMSVVAYTRHGIEHPGHDDPKFREAESGQVLLDRVRYKDVLEWLWYLNSHPEVVYKSMHGDKDSFRLAFTLAGKAVNYTQVPHVALTAFHGTSQAPDATFVWMGMVQTLPSGQLATHHRTAHTKWFPKFSEDKDLEGGLANWITAPVPEKQVKAFLDAGGSISAAEADYNAWEHACDKAMAQRANTVMKEVCNFPERRSDNKFHLVPSWLLGRNVAHVLNASVEIVRHVREVAGKEVPHASN